MASVRKRDPKDPESPWVCEYTDASGKRRRITPKTGMKKDADAARRKIERELEEGTHTPDADTLTIAALGEEFLRALERRMRDGEIGRYHHDNLKAGIVHHIQPHLGKTLVSKLSAKQVRDFYDVLRETMGAYSAKKRLTQLVVLEAFAIRRGYTRASTSKMVSAEYRHNRSSVRTFTLDEIGALLKTADERCRTLSWTSKRGNRALHMTRLYVHLAALCGLRCGEIAALTRANVDVIARVVRVRHSLTAWGELKGPKTKAGIRDVPLPGHLAVALREWLERFYIPNELSFVFQSAKGKPVHTSSFNSQYWLPLLKAAGIRCGDDVPHFHALRHFAASWMIENGLAITEVASLLGHATVDMTLQVYAHPIVGGHKRADAMDRMAMNLLAAPKTIELLPSQAQH